MTTGKALNVMVNGRSPDHRNSPTTETSLSLMNKARETRERHTDKFHNSMSSLGFEPPNHGVAAIRKLLLLTSN